MNSMEDRNGTKKPYIPQFAMLRREVHINLHYQNARVHNLLWYKFKGYYVNVRDIPAVVLVRQELLASEKLSAGN